MAGAQTSARTIGPSSYRDTFSAVLKMFVPLWPCVLGLGCARISLVVTNYGSFTSTDEGIFTDGSMIAALFVMGILLIVHFCRKPAMKKTWVNRFMRLCIIAEAAIVCSMAVLDYLGFHGGLSRLILSAFSALFASGALFYWLRRARKSSSTTTAVFVFSALFLSEIVIYACSWLPSWVCESLVVGLTLLQLPSMIWAQRGTQPYLLDSPEEATDYFGFAKGFFSDRLFLLATGVGVACLSLVIGLLRGYPSGLPIEFTAITRTATFVLTLLVCGCLLLAVLRFKHQVMTVGIWVVMQFLACVALITYAAFPTHLDIGAVFTTTLNTLLSGFMWYLIIAFMSYGKRDPYFYAIIGWFIWLGFRAIARLALLQVYPFAANDLLMNAFMAGALMLSAQVVYTQFLRIMRKDSLREVEAVRKKRGAFEKLFMLEEDDSLSSARLKLMQHNAEEMGKQFLLSKREMEVLSLYAMGFTQKRVAEELFISPSTAHAHIKRIYANTGMHSRQEILDYMEKYTS